MKDLEDLSKEELKEVLGTEKGVQHFCKTLFVDEEGNPLELTDYQAEIVLSLLKKHPKRQLIWAATRSGKSFALAIGAILSAVMRPGEKIRLIGPTKDHAKIIMDYILDHLSDHETIVESLSATGGRSVKDLRKELSKEKITFENGSEISVLTASVDSGGRSLLGKGGSIVIVDEAERIPSELIRNKILRMVGERSNAQLLLVSNPTFPDERGFMYEKKDVDRWYNRRIGWEDAVQEGRLERDFIEEQREEMSKAEFEIWYEARYPDEIDGGLLRADWVEDAIKRKFNPEQDASSSTVYGLDVAEGGEDMNVLTKVERISTDDSVRHRVVWQESWREEDTMQTVSNVESLKEKDERIMIDAIGIGKGVGDALKERGHNVELLKVHKQPTREKERFLNRKTQYYWRIRELFENGRISIPDSDELEHQLLSMKHEYTSRGKMRIVDPSKSPDHADSLCFALHGAEEMRAGKPAVLDIEMGELFASQKSDNDLTSDIGRNKEPENPFKKRFRERMREERGL
ncbi:MAG: DEAD/DEAH box helicase family protein [Candidatus Nanohaloarchaea archaeon]